MGSGGSTRSVGYCNKIANGLTHGKYKGRTIRIWENMWVSLRCGCSELPLRLFIVGPWALITFKSHSQAV